MKKNILVVVNPKQDGHALLDWYHNNTGFEFTIADTDEKAIELAHQRDFDLAIADGTDQDIDIKKLNAVLSILDEDLQLVSYSGETVAVFNDHIRSIFDSRKAERLQRLMILDSSQKDMWSDFSQFSAN